MTIRKVWLSGFLITGMSAGLVHAQTTAGKHCVSDIDPVQPGAQSGSVVKKTDCFATVAEALMMATDGSACRPADPRTDGKDIRCAPQRWKQGACYRLRQCEFQHREWDLLMERRWMRARNNLRN